MSLSALLKTNNVEAIIELILNNGVDPSSNYNEAIEVACQNGSTELVRLLLQDDRVDPGVDGDYPIGIASENGYTETVRLLLQDDRVDPSGDDDYAIRSASENGNTETVRLLLQDDRVDPSAHDDYAILSAIENGDIEIIRLLAQWYIEKGLYENISEMINLSSFDLKIIFNNIMYTKKLSNVDVTVKCENTELIVDQTIITKSKVLKQLLKRNISQNKGYTLDLSSYNEYNWESCKGFKLAFDFMYRGYLPSKDEVLSLISVVDGESVIGLGDEFDIDYLDLAFSLVANLE